MGAHCPSPVSVAITEYLRRAVYKEKRFKLVYSSGVCYGRGRDFATSALGVVVGQMGRKHGSQVCLIQHPCLMISNGLTMAEGGPDGSQALLLQPRILGTDSLT